MNRPLALITGAGRSVGIAAGIARQLATDGWNLALNSWADYDNRMPWAGRPTGTNELIHELIDSGADVLHLPGNLEDVATAGALFQTLSEQGATPSALVLAHCESVDSSIMTTTVESFDRHYAVNVRASWQLIREFALHVPSSGGQIIAFTSDALFGNVPYGATKAALDRLILASARELADRHIRANVINPGPIDTGWMSDEIRRQCIKRQPNGRLGTPADIANFVSLLLSEKGAWVNGQLLKVDGGFSI